MSLSNHRQAVIVSCLLTATAAAVWLTFGGSKCEAVEAGFWFEDVAYGARSLGEPITPEEIATIAFIARTELVKAFAGLDVAFSERRDVRFGVRVVQELRDMRFRRHTSIPAESRAVSGFGGAGAVSFSWLASSAVTYAPEDAERTAIIEAIGRGIGRAAVHEFSHLFLPTAAIHDTSDVQSYEYASAARREQYFGDMRWSHAWPLLEERIGRCGNALEP